MTEDLLFFMAVGFAAQMIDGATGMAYGVTSTSVLLSFGLPPATASACTHTAEVFTTGASGVAHWRLGNIDRRLVWRLAIPGVIGGVAGAYLLTSLPADAARPFISAYLLALGLFILWKAIRNAVAPAPSARFVAPLGFAGGFLDAIGGGGWGPMVASTLLSQGAQARYAIGSVILAEFFVTAAISATFIFTIGTDLWMTVAGLVIGGVLAAPLSALATKHLPDRVLMSLVGMIVVLLSLRELHKALV